MTVGRLNYLKKLFTYLRPEKQNEDCLYLNVYSPSKSNYESGKTCHAAALEMSPQCSIVVDQVNNVTFMEPLVVFQDGFNISLIRISVMNLHL